MSEYFVEDCIYRLKRIAFVVFAMFLLMMFGASTSYAQSVSPPTASFTANPTTITAGQSTLLSWISNNTTYCLGDNGLSPSGTGGTYTIYPSVTTTYTITCTGPGGSTSAIAMVNVVPPTVPLVA